MITTTTTHRAEVPGTDLTFEVEGPIPEPHDDDIWVRTLTDDPDGDAYAVSWLVHDPYGYEAHEWGNPDDDPKEWVNGCFRDFRNDHHGGGEEARNAFYRDMVEAVGEDRVFIVDVYAHGLEHFSRSNSRFYPDRKWDVAPACVLAVPPDVTNPAEWADGVLKEWTAVVNGDTWLIVTHFLRADGSVRDCQVIGGYTGRDVAEECAKAGDY